jgi:hypothetical protein
MDFAILIDPSFLKLVKSRRKRAESENLIDPKNHAALHIESQNVSLSTADYHQIACFSMGRALHTWHA